MNNAQCHRILRLSFNFAQQIVFPTLRQSSAKNGQMRSKNNIPSSNIYKPLFVAHEKRQKLKEFGKRSGVENVRFIYASSTTQKAESEMKSKRVGMHK